MSKNNKRRNQTRETAAIEVTVQSDEAVTPTDVSQTKSSSLRNKIAYLKNHWWAVGLIVFFSLGVMGAGLKYLEDDAKRIMTDRSTTSRLNPPNEGLLSKINPFLSAPMPSPTPQLSKELIYAGGKLLAVEDANATAVPPADLAVWRPSTGVWWVSGGQGSQQVSQSWGLSGDIPVAGDYDGDGKTDFSIFRPNPTAQTGTWYVYYSSNSSWTSFQFGMHNDIVAQADYDGDGKTDAGLFRPSNGMWYIFRSSDSGVTSTQFGSSGDLPVPADYDGDGKADIGIWRNSNTTFYSTNSTNQSLQTIVVSQTSSQPVSGDYDGDGKADYAIRNGANWIIRNSSTGTIQTPISWQSSGDKAVQNDYDGDGKVDIAVWNNTNGNWYIRQSSNGQLRQEAWGLTGDIPVPAFYRR